jgi:NADPH:quinone reductase-like Zn-dependent oxidoreductase
MLQIRELPVPAVREGWSLVQVKGAGLNRSELRTRQGHSPSVSFPRVLGIECAGIVAVSTDPLLPAGTTVAAVMGEMGREFDGGYAEYALLPNALLMPVTTALPWDVLAALPETYLTAQGSLDALGIGPDDRGPDTQGADNQGPGSQRPGSYRPGSQRPGSHRPGSQRRLLIRGGTSSVGLAAASIATGYGIATAATTRRPGKIDALAAAGVDHPLVDDGASLDGASLDGASLTASVHAIWPEGPDYVLDLVGTSTAVDSLHLVRRGGTVCISGSLSGWLIPDFEPIAMIPSGTRLTAFHSDNAQGSAGATILQRVIRQVEAGVYRPSIDRVFGLDDIVAAHQHMEDNQAAGKVVVLP